MRHPISVLALSLVLTAACGAFSVVDSQPGEEDGGAADAGPDGGNGPIACIDLDFCACEEAPACKGVNGDCFCPCGDECMQDCACACGGGPFLCVPAECPTVLCGADEELVLDANGCGVCIPPAGQCEGRDFCACWQEPACRFISEGCLCPCDYQCPGEEPCDCVCGGGPYLGCQDATCPPVECRPGEVLERDSEGCGVCVPSNNCSDLAYCDCEAVQHCQPVTNIGFCACDTGCDPTDPICDCAPPPFEPTYAGCADVTCPDPGCDTSTQMFLMGTDGCPVCAPRPDVP